MLETVPSLPFVAESISVHPHMTISLELKEAICLGVCVCVCVWGDSGLEAEAQEGHEAGGAA